MGNQLPGMIEQGGWIMWPIIFSSLVVWWLGLWKWYTVLRLGRARRRFLAIWANAAPSRRHEAETMFQ